MRYTFFHGRIIESLVQIFQIDISNEFFLVTKLLLKTKEINFVGKIIKNNMLNVIKYILNALPLPLLRGPLIGK